MHAGEKKGRRGWGGGDDCPSFPFWLYKLVIEQRPQEFGAAKPAGPVLALKDKTGEFLHHDPPSSHVTWSRPTETYGDPGILNPLSHFSASVLLDAHEAASCDDFEQG